jgi:arsenite methyltransferase
MSSDPIAPEDEMARAEKLPQADASSLVDRGLLEGQVQEMYRQVAREEEGQLHFAVGRPIALRVGYPAELLDAIPAEAVASFAGVGYHLDLAALAPGEEVLDLGSGSGTDVFCAAVQVGASGHVVGVDFTDEQLGKATRLRDRDGFTQVKFVEASIDALPFEDASFDAVISNGVINLSPVKHRVLAEASSARAEGSRLPTSSAAARSRSVRDATSSSGPRASPARFHATAISVRSKPQAFGSERCAPTTTTSFPNAPSMPAVLTASRASRSQQ